MLAIVQEFFIAGCPKFVSPVLPSADSLPRSNASLVRLAMARRLRATDLLAQEPTKLQLKVFMMEMSQQVLTPFVRSFLKLYTTMPLAKLASFIGLVRAAPNSRPSMADDGH